jgi:hypothetical protein
MSFPYETDRAGLYRAHAFHHKKPEGHGSGAGRSPERKGRSSIRIVAIRCRLTLQGGRIGHRWALVSGMAETRAQAEGAH